MAGGEFRHLRAELLAQVHGEVLELGIGTGLNLPHYPKAVSWIHAVDPANLLPKIVKKRSTSQSFPIRIQHVTAESLPYDNFDFAVSTWTLCTIPDPVKALREVRRVLKPDGVFLFLAGCGKTRFMHKMPLESSKWRRCQNSVRMLKKAVQQRRGERRGEAKQAGLKIMALDRFQMQSVPRLGGEMYKGGAAT